MEIDRKTIEKGLLGLVSGLPYVHGASIQARMSEESMPTVFFDLEHEPDRVSCSYLHYSRAGGIITTAGDHRFPDETLDGITRRIQTQVPAVTAKYHIGQVQYNSWSNLTPEDVAKFL